MSVGVGAGVRVGGRLVGRALDGTAVGGTALVGATVGLTVEDVAGAVGAGDSAGTG
ncbi:MAG: hypothetical protein ABWY56_06745 [Propionibacteriaceae bacterium]